MAKVFFSYSHDDESYRDQLEKHLAALKRGGLIEAWHDRRLLAGSSVDAAIDEQIVAADVILLLVSASFISSDYCFSKEMTRALERHAAGAARVVPIIVRPCDWQSTPFGSLLAAPRDGKAITTWANPDEAYTDVARHIRGIVEAAAQAPRTVPEAPTAVAAEPPAPPPPARSSNLRLRKQFADEDAQRFLREAFDFAARFFDSSLRELQARNPDIGGAFVQLDDTAFRAAIYRAGQRRAECTVRLQAGGFGGGRLSCTRPDGTGDVFVVDSDDQAMFLRLDQLPDTARLSEEGAAERLWAALIAPLQ